MVKTFELMEWQQKVLDSDSKLIILNGGMGCGKTWAGVQWVLKMINQGKNGIVYTSRRRGFETITKILDGLGTNFEASLVRRVFTFENGSTLKFIYEEDINELTLDYDISSNDFIWFHGPFEDRTPLFDTVLHAIRDNELQANVLIEMEAGESDRVPMYHKLSLSDYVFQPSARHMNLYMSTWYYKDLAKVGHLHTGRHWLNEDD